MKVQEIKTNIPYAKKKSRINRLNWSLEKTLTTPNKIRKRKKKE